MKKIVVFASGSGSNAENIANHFNQKKNIEVVSFFCNNPEAKVIDRAKKINISIVLFSKEELNNDTILLELNKIQPDLIILAGFLLKFPEKIISDFYNKIVNIHPALLSKYGGKGMYGSKVHQAVLENKELETGITIHYVNKNYDEGAIIFQKSVSIENCKTVDEIASKIHELEHEFFPLIIEKILFD